MNVNTTDPLLQDDAWQDEKCNDTVSRRFPKSMRISLQKEIEAIFRSGQSFMAYPLRVVYLLVDKSADDVAVMVSVSKKRFKRAVKRNRIKRLTRETFRLSSQHLVAQVESLPCSLRVAFLFVDNQLPTYTTMDEAMKKALGKLEQRLRGVSTEVFVLK